MATGSEERSALLKTDLSAEIDRIEGQRRRSKRHAFALRAFTVMASAAITVLLGLKAGGSAG